MEYKRQSPTAVKVKPRLIIHGGAGNIKPANLAPPQYAEYRAALLTIISKTNAYMTTPTPTTTATAALPSALETAVHAVTLLENNPLFNSGHGAVFTRDGINELEASVMVTRGFAKRGVGVTGLRHVRNPILLAKAMLEHGEADLGGGSDSHPSSSEIDAPSAQGHTLLHGPTAEVLAEKYGLELVEPGYFFTQRRWDEHIRALERERTGEEGNATWSRSEFLPQGTVGAVALDEEGVVCAATSTGGLTNKLTGRIGDTPSVGAGFWAEEWVEEGDPTGVFGKGGFGSGGVMLSESLRGLMADCLPSLSVYTPAFGKAVKTTRAIAASGTGNGDSFWRVAAGRTVGAVARFKPLSGKEAVSFVAGAGGELQRSAGDRWRVTGEGEGGIIGIEVAVTRDEEGGVVGVRSEILQDFNCNGMYRAWIDDEGLAHAKIYHDEVEEGVDARLYAEKW